MPKETQEQYWNRREQLHQNWIWSQAERYERRVAALYRNTARDIGKKVERFLEPLRDSKGGSIDVDKLKSSLKKKKSPTYRNYMNLVAGVLLLIESTAEEVEGETSELLTMVGTYMTAQSLYDIAKTTGVIKPPTDGFKRKYQPIDKRTVMTAIQVDKKRKKKPNKSRKDLYKRTVLSHNWTTDGKTFSDRLWSNQKKLKREATGILTEALVEGKNPNKAGRELAKRMDVANSAAQRLIRTETTATLTRAKKESFKQQEATQGRLLVNFDNRTSKICQPLHNRIVDMTNGVIGKDLPPFHPNCRTTVIPFIDDSTIARRKMSVKDKDNKYHLVPSDMSFKEFERKYLK